MVRDANPPYLIGRLPIFVNIFVHFDTKICQPSYFWQGFLPLKLHVIFLDVNVGISAMVNSSHCLGSLRILHLHFFF